MKPVLASRCQEEAEHQSAKLTSCIEVQYDINNEGGVQNIKILDAFPNGRYGKDLLAAITKWRYQTGNPHIGNKVTIIFVEK